MAPSGPVQHDFQASKARITYFEWGNPEHQTLLFLHATGFHARCWDEVIKRLPDNLHVIAVDQRCHGRSEETGLLTNWPDHAHDIVELVEGLDLKNIIGIGHSMGAFCMAYAGGTRPERFEHLLLIDPVMMSPQMYEDWKSKPHDFGADHPVARRRNQWANWTEMFERFKDRRPYDLWDKKVLEDYCKYGVLPAENGEGFRLACPPESEASVYMNSLSQPIYDITRKVTAPVTILRAKTRNPDEERDPLDFTLSPTWKGVAAQFQKARDVYLPHYTHFIPMQDPGFIANCIMNEEEALSQF